MEQQDTNVEPVATQLLQAMFGDTTPMHAAEAGRACGLVSRLCMLTQRCYTLDRQAFAEQGLSPEGVAYGDWLKAEIRKVCEQAPNVSAVEFDFSPSELVMLTLTGGQRNNEHGWSVRLPALAPWLIEGGNVWEHDPMYAEVLECRRAESAIPKMQADILEALPVGDGDYNDGYRNALESLTLAFMKARVDPQIVREALDTALDAHSNNVTESPSMR